MSYLQPEIIKRYCTYEPCQYQDEEIQYVDYMQFPDTETQRCPECGLFTLHRKQKPVLEGFVFLPEVKP